MVDGLYREREGQESARTESSRHILNQGADQQASAETQDRTGANEKFDLVSTRQRESHSHSIPAHVAQVHTPEGQKSERVHEAAHPHEAGGNDVDGYAVRATHA
jgi:hypothetical protein